MSDIFQRVPIGKTFVSPGRTISEGDFSLLVNLTWATSPIHTDAEYMKSTPFGERIFPGVCALSMAIGLANTSGFRPFLRSLGLGILSLLAIDNVRFPAPLFSGDTISVETEFVEARATSKPHRGLIRLKETVRKQTGDIVVEYSRLEMYERID